MAKTYNAGPCRFCGRRISNAGFAAHAHKMMHVRQGLMTHRYYYSSVFQEMRHEFLYTEAGQKAIREQTLKRREAKQ